MAVAAVPGAARADVDARYPDLQVIGATLDELAAAHPSAAVLVPSQDYDLPTSEGRQVRALAVGRGARPVLVIGGLHGRELAPPLTALLLARALIDGDGLDPDITALLDSSRVYIAPMWNPDGYAFVRESDPQWRKNRAPHGATIGVDLNRNFDAAWDSPCAGDEDPASRLYKGPAPASENETRLMIAWAEDIPFEAVLDLHASGRMVVVGPACGQRPRADLDELAVELAERLGYAGATRRPAGDGELHQWFSNRGAPVSLLVELGEEQQPDYDAAVAEADATIPGLIWALGDGAPSGGGCRAASRDPGLALALALALLSLPWRRRRRSRRDGPPFAPARAVHAASRMRADPDPRRARR